HGGDAPIEDVAVHQGVKEDFILAEEAGEGEDAGNGQGGHYEGPIGDGHVFPEAAHVAHILLAVHAVDYRAGSQEEEGLEKGVGHEMEDTGNKGPHAAGHDHIAQLAHGGVSQNAFDVVLRHAHGGGEKGGQQAHYRHHRQGDRGQHEQGAATGQHIDPRGDHGGRVDQGGHRGGAFHGVGQPDVERNLGRLAGGPQKQAEGGGGDHRGAHRITGGGREDLPEIEAAEGPEDDEDAQQEAEIADAVDHEGLFARVAGRAALIPKADQEVGAEPYAFPTHEHQQEVIGAHQDEHIKDEE